MPENQSKTFTEWLFDLDEYLTHQDLPMRSDGFERGALVYGFTNGLTPEAFVKDACNRPASTSTQAQANVEPSVHTYIEDNRGLRPLPILIGAASVLVLLLLFVAVPKLLHGSSTEPHGILGPSPEFKASATRAVESVEAVDSAVTIGTSFNDYGPRVTQAQIDVDHFANEYGSNEALAVPLKEAVKHYANALAVWDAWLQNSWHTPSKTIYPAIQVLWDEYPESHDYFGNREETKDHLFLKDEALSLLWSKGGEAAKRARAILSNGGTLLVTSNPSTNPQSVVVAAVAADGTPSAALAVASKFAWNQSFEGPYHETDDQGDWSGKIWLDVDASGHVSGRIWLPSSEGDQNSGIVSRLAQDAGSADGINLTDDCIMAGGPDGVPAIPWSNNLPSVQGHWTVSFQKSGTHVSASGTGISGQGNKASFSAG